MSLIADKASFLKQQINYEKERTTLPAGYPAFPLVPRQRYMDPAFHDLEQKYLWPRAWLLAGHLDEIPEPGCYKTWDMPGIPVIIMRTRNGEVKAFHNSCRHRGALVARQPYGRSPTLVCGYHGWSYDNDGRLIRIQSPREFAPFDLSCRSLVPVKCERLGKLIYVNFDPSSISLQEYLGPLRDEWKQYELDSLRLVHHYTWDLDCNWKVAMEGNIENYHLWNIHGDVIPPFYVKDEYGNITLYKGGHARDITACEGKVAWMRENASVDDPSDIAGLGEIAREHLESYNIFPNGLLSAGSTYHVNAPLFWPKGYDRCRFEIYHLAVDWGPGERPKIWDQVIKFYDTVFGQDNVFTDTIWGGMKSPAFDGAFLGYPESRIYHWHQSFDEFVGRENLPQDMRVEPAIGPEWIYPQDGETRARLFDRSPLTAPFGDEAP
ncbi:MAG: SRPBCC family protein [Burkholderiales bacterium]